MTRRIIFRKENQKYRPLRNSNEIELTKARRSCGQNSLFHKGIKIFNSIPNDIKNIESEQKFIKALKSYVKQNH